MTKGYLGKFVGTSDFVAHDMNRYFKQVHTMKMYIYYYDIKSLLIGYLSLLNASVEQNLVVTEPVAKGFHDGDMPPLNVCRH